MTPGTTIRSICLLRLSALGDVCHTVPLVRAIQDQCPGARVTWIIGRQEASLVAGLEDVEFVVFDKQGGWRAVTALRRQLRGRRFDALLATQRSLRANLLAHLVRADLRVGYDTARARELHGWTVNARIRPGAADQHVMDCLLSFLEPLGLTPPLSPRWDIPVSAADEAFARRHIPPAQDTVILSPASSHAVRNWRAEHYAAIADHAITGHGLRVLLCGGPSTAERALGDAIVHAMRAEPVDMIGRDTLKQFLALAARARLVITPDSGPAHMATAVGTPVLGLYAATDCRRSGPYYSRDLCVNAYATAALRFTGRPANKLRWGKHIHADGVMDLVRPEEVIARLERLMSAAHRSC